MEKMEEFEFPSGFLWGAATSSHQVEGGTRNDWSEWERANARRLAEEAILRQSQGINPWPDFILNNYPNPLQEENYISGTACDHYNRFREDFDIAKELGHNAHRFSIEWSRIEPEEGKFDEKEIGHYREVIRALRERGMEPFVTLWHWTNPLWVRDIGGWENIKTVSYFVRYCDKIVKALGNDIKFWLTLNEPNVYAGASFLKGVWPPQKKSPLALLRVFANLAKAHRHSYQTIKQISPLAHVGVAQNIIHFSGVLGSLKQWLWNDWFLRKTFPFHDFIGVNYYFSNRKTEERSEFMDWPIDPEAFYWLLCHFKHYQKPIYITENGIADARDEKRARFIKDHLRWVAKAMQEGVDVRGYFHWSLLDNFEWASGSWPRFGLVEVDYKTMQRKIRPSAREYKKIIELGLEK